MNTFYIVDWMRVHQIVFVRANISDFTRGNQSNEMPETVWNAKFIVQQTKNNTKNVLT